jgi:hypothetical protein
MKVRTDYIPLTDSTAWALVTIQFDRKDLSYKDDRGVSSAFVEVSGRITNLARKYITSFDHDLKPPGIPTPMLEQSARGPDIFQTSLSLKPGTYKLNITAVDENSKNTSHQDILLQVPHLEDDRLTSSSLILADVEEKVDRHSIGMGKDMFVISEDKVRPRMPGDDGRPNFKRATDPYLYIYWRIYNLEPDMIPDANGLVKKADGSVKYELVKDDAKGATQIVAFSEDDTDIIKRTNSGPAVMVVKKQLNLKDMEPGKYTLKMTAIDQKRNQTVTQSAPFTIN